MAHGSSRRGPVSDCGITTWRVRWAARRSGERGRKEPVSAMPSPTTASSGGNRSWASWSGGASRRTTPSPPAFLMRTASSSGVFRDPIATPDERYKMIYAATESRQRLLEPHLPWPAGMRASCAAPIPATATTGPATRKSFLGKYGDTQNVATYDPVLGKYVAHIRQIGHHNAGRDDAQAFELAQSADDSLR